MLAVLTTSARTRYLVSTLHQIESQPGNHSRHVFFDGPSNGFERPGWEVHELPKEASGNAVAFWKVLAEAYVRCTDLVFFEDDIELCDNAVPYIESFPVPRDIEMVSFVSALTSECCPWGLYRAHGSSFMLCQALKITARGLSAVLETRKAPKGVHSDTNLGAALFEARIKWGVHVPDLVKHVGEESVANPGNPLALTRVGRTYKGQFFDALLQLRSAHDVGIYR